MPQLIYPSHIRENRAFDARAAITMSFLSVLLILPRLGSLPEFHLLVIRPLLGEPLP